MTRVDPCALRVEEFVPERAGREQWDAVHEFRREIAARLEAEPPPAKAAVEADLTEPHTSDVRRLFGCLIGPRVVSACTVRWPAAAPPGARMFVHAEVLRDVRRQGIGRRWLPTVRALLRESGAGSILFRPTDDDGHAFLRRIGATEMPMIESRLQFQAIDWTVLARWSERGRRQLPGVTLECHAPCLPETLWEEMSRAYAAVFASQEADWDPALAPMTADEIRRDHLDLAKTRSELHTLLARAPDRAIAGYTAIRRNPRQPRIVRQWLTGVLPAWRGRGLATWLKAECLDHLRRHAPDTEWLVTLTAPANAAMASITGALGFVPYRRLDGYRLTAAGLDRAVAALDVSTTRNPCERVK